ncbi:MAG: 2-oxoacid:acceptor oxidoreductase family protein [Candidatus Hermodarchaeota archaeon]
MITNNNSYTIVITGLGGQGLITLIQILGESIAKKGYKVITSEKHGLSQRGGTVICFLRFGEKIAAPIPLLGSAKMILATEKSCVLDVLQYANPDRSTKIIVSEYKKKVINSEYPPDKYISDTLKEHSKDLHFLSTEILQKKPKVTNIFILGYIIRYLPIEITDVEEQLRNYFSGKSLVLNLNALNNGYKF